jgi:hypothetical protein
MMGIHDIFPPDAHHENDPILLKNLLKGDGQYSTQKCLLGFDFNGDKNTLRLEDSKLKTLLQILHSWLGTARQTSLGIPFQEFESVIAKICYAFTSIPAGRRLLSPCKRLLKKQPQFIYLACNETLCQSIEHIRTLLRDSTLTPMRCRKLVIAWTDFIGVCNASSHGVRGVILGENSTCTPTVFRYEGPDKIQSSIQTQSNPSGTITNSNLKMAGILLLWLIMGKVCPPLIKKHVPLFSNNTPIISWVSCLASKKSKVAKLLVRALALRLKATRTCPLTLCHIAGLHNSMTDIPSRSLEAIQRGIAKPRRTC